MNVMTPIATAQAATSEAELERLWTAFLVADAAYADAHWTTDDYQSEAFDAVAEAAHAAEHELVALPAAGALAAAMKMACYMLHAEDDLDADPDATMRASVAAYRAAAEACGRDPLAEARAGRAAATARAAA